MGEGDKKVMEDKKMDTEKDKKKDTKGKGKGKGKEKEKEELSEEDLELKADLEMLVERVQEADQDLQKQAITQLAEKIRTSTSSMTSVPKPLKFLRPFYGTLRSYLLEYKGSNEKQLADVVSVLAMTMAEEGSHDALNFKLKGSLEEVGLWGHEYLRHLSREIGEEYSSRVEKAEGGEEPVMNDLMELVSQIVPYNMTHHAEHEACDLLMEVGKLSMILDLIDEKNYSRVCLYLQAASNYVPEPEDTDILAVVLSIYKKTNQLCDALTIALKMGNVEETKAILESTEDESMKKQLCFLLGRHHMFEIETEDDELDTIIGQGSLSENFISLGRELDVAEAKTPEDIYKSHLVESRFTNTTDSARKNLADTFVNAFVNAGFGQDKLMSTDGAKWVFRNKEHAMLSATASHGMILQWDVLNGINVMDKYTHFKDDHVKAGALLGVGILNSGVRNECDPALALLAEFVENESKVLRVSAVLGLGIAYVGSNRDDLLDILSPLLEEPELPMEVFGMVCLALGMIFVGTSNGDISFLIYDALNTRNDEALKSTYARFACLGLGLLYLGKQEEVEVTVEMAKSLSSVISKYAVLTVETCAYAGTGDVLKIQEMLHTCTDHIEKADEAAHQAVAVIGIALISLGEEIGSDMSLRTFNHLLQYGEPVIRRAVPLALGLHSTSNPRLDVMDTLSKLSHDHDNDVARNAILAIGMIGAGTNNSRAAQLLRDLFVYHYKDTATVFIVRVAQGLLHMGKGTMSLSPFHTHKFLMDRVAICGLLSVLHSGLDMTNLILGESHYLLFLFVLAMNPRMLMTFDEEMNQVHVDVRVGQALDTVGQAGQPKTLTGFQTHKTPVLLGSKDRAELATDEWVSLTKFMEGHVILKKNPDFVGSSSSSSSSSS